MRFDSEWKCSTVCDQAAAVLAVPVPAVVPPVPRDLALDPVVRPDQADALAVPADLAN